jgi:hypothetical protein
MAASVESWGWSMTAKRVEDFFLADDLEAIGYGPLAAEIRSTETHEDVEHIEAQLLRLLDCFDMPGLP